MQTADNWASDPSQCMVPGFGKTPLYLNNGQTNPATSYPITYDQKNACNYAVYSSNLVDILQPVSYIYGTLYAWKVRNISRTIRHCWPTLLLKSFERLSTLNGYLYVAQCSIQINCNLHCCRTTLISCTSLCP